MRVNPADFDAPYRDAPDGDPWAFHTSAYERRRYDLSVGCLDRERYRRAFEPGCSVGALTVRLAERCDELVAIDPSPTALERARQLVGDRPGVELAVGAIPEAWPDGRFDLVVLSEIGYYFDVDALEAVIHRALASLTTDGQLLAVHWRGDSDDHLLHGDTVHRVLEATIGRAPTLRLEDPGFLCARWDRP